MRYAATLILLVLSACGEKDFDQQYAETEKQLKADAARIDREMAAQAKQEPGEAKQQK
jgi:hypothetical protein